MTNDELLKEAAELKKPSEEAAGEYSDKKELLADHVNKGLSSRTDIENLVGKNNVDVMMDNHRNHTKFMESIFTSYDPEMFVNTVLWVFRTYLNHGFKLDYWDVMFKEWYKALEKNLSSESLNQIMPFYEWMHKHKNDFAALSREK